MLRFTPGIVALCVFAMVGVVPAEPAANATPLQLHLRTRVETFKGSGAWDEVTLARDFNGKETAIVICDVWDKHWCDNATERCGVLAKKIAAVLPMARALGITVIHAPSECMDFYKDTPQRKRLADVKRIAMPELLKLNDPPLPVDDSDGGCDDEKPVKFFKAWTRQHAAIAITDEDGTSDNGDEIYSFLRERGIKNVIFMGVHTNMCVLGRSFAIRRMTRLGIHCILARDLTDSMYNPKMKPFVNHDEGTELIVQHIEKYWCPTILSKDFSKEAEQGK